MYPKCPIYKNDLKFNNFKYAEKDGQSEKVKNLNMEYENKPKLLFRIKDCEMENYEYLDLSNLSMDDDQFEKLCGLDVIINILNRIKFLDLSTNDLHKMPNISCYKNIIYLNVSNNKISGSINNNLYIEFTCDHNLIETINSTSITYLSASNNKITSICVPNIQTCMINHNLLDNLNNLSKLTYLECSDNKIINIQNNMLLKELFIADNLLETIKNMPSLKILNCVNNPLNKIAYMSNIDTLFCSTNRISTQYKINTISKIKNNYVIKFHVLI